MRLRHELCAGLVVLAATASTCRAGDGLTLPKDVVLPANVTVAIYLPKQVREFRSVFRSAGGFQTTDSVQLGNTFEETTLESARHFFNTSFMYEAAGTPGYGLLIAMHPRVKSEDRQLVATAHYAVFNSAGVSVLKGDSAVRWAPGFGGDNSDIMGRLTEQVINRTLTDIVAQLRPTADKFPTGEKTPLNLDLLVDKDHAATSGTGFFVNGTGQLLTAAHVVHNCAVIDVRYGENILRATVTASSALLDMAVLDTHVSSEHFLSLRHEGRLELGESVANIGFPLQSMMTDAPTVTRGSLSSRAGLTGSLGQFQFSAPIQPGASGGEHTMHYELCVNGQRILRYEYSTKLSRSEYMHGKTVDATHGLGPDGVVWAKSTVDLFLNDLAHDNSVRALNEEYQAYFGPLAPAAGIAVTSQP